MVFKRVAEGRPYPAHGLTSRQWATIRPSRVRLADLVMTRSQLDLSALLVDDSTYFGDLFAHVVQWRGDLYLEDGLHRALRAALGSHGDPTLHARIHVADDAMADDAVAVSAGAPTPPPRPVSAAPVRPGRAERPAR